MSEPTMPCYAYDDWEWIESVGWVNPEDDPATWTEAALLDEIKRLRSIVVEWRDADREFNASASPHAARRYVATMDALRKEAKR